MDDSSEKFNRFYLTKKIGSLVDLPSKQDFFLSLSGISGLFLLMLMSPPLMRLDDDDEVVQVDPRCILNL